ncbi:hypothetical protein GGX14DRAFT_555074 [Mycena pura]|uniref:Uncharacterized protein n=1 Tax=Mycena pura TaxID=153505 RepID=A0AAD6YTX5_9AGAR|nr:hypothetical protein GGX14DRAFT_555074 [Mycena pura]
MGRDSKTSRFGGRKRKRSEAQKEHLLDIGASTSDSSLPTRSSYAGKENTAVVDLQKAKERADGYQNSFYNERKKVKRSHKVNADQVSLLADSRHENGRLRAEVGNLEAEVGNLEAEVSCLQAESSSLRADVASQTSARRRLGKKVHTLVEKVRRIPARIDTAINKAKAQAKDELSQLFSFTLKEKGVIPDETRDMINDLVALDSVRPNKVVGVLKRIVGKLGIGVTGNTSDRSVRRIVKEGGVAARMQFVEAVGKSKGVTLSSDGTTHKNINLESHRATVIDQNSEKQTFFLGIGMAINHTSETQLEGWEELIEEMYKIYRTSSRCETTDDARDFWLKVTGWHSDHAEDQKKLFRLARELKLKWERQRRGEQAFSEMAPAQWADSLFLVSHNVVAAAGGISAWEKIGDAERCKHNHEVFTDFIRTIGQAEFNKLTPEEQQNIDLFIWGGCCMHKSLNVFKSSILAMQQWWIENNIPGPLKMFNRDNAAAVTLGEGTGAASCAEDRTSGGAMKVASLAGAIFRHKDRKRGQQDTLRYFWDHETGFNICFPDTSNTRFQSHAAACEIIVFLVYVRENKASRTLNHMEKNVERGLLCTPTRNEFVVIALMNQNVDVPYMLEIRGPLRKEDNLLKLGELHRKVRAHLERIMANPKIITGLDAAFETATLNGRPWEKPEVVYAALKRISEWKLENVDDLVVTSCKGALTGWARFDTEWADDGPISKLSPDNIERAWLEATNDGNESELGILRQAAKPSPNMSLPYHSAMRMYKANHTSAYMPTLASSDRQEIRAQVRSEDASGMNQQRKHAQIVHMKEVVDRNIDRDNVRKERVTKAQQELANTTMIASVAELDTAFQIPVRTLGYLTVAALDLQLNWHLANPIPEHLDSQVTSASGIPKAKSGANGRGNQDSRFTFLREAILKRGDFQQSSSMPPTAPVVPEDYGEAMPGIEPPEVVRVLQPVDVDDAGYDSEEAWYSG